MYDERRRNQSFLSRMLNFDTMITPTIIKIIYVIVTGIGMLFGVTVFLMGLSGGGSGFETLGGLLIITASPFVNRIWCEGMIVIFKIHENLNKIANR